uniref:uncharacterized protein LOC105349260 n=1 Tax=Fragaria vesca subsp. vesca TaxID=101020 RepID=UPI0005C8A9EE|nr:PREDICTED: uncharacterized protein LOC105349260 [Fragaria vesca subsp. vesca]
MGFGQKAWRNVRKDLLQELQSMPSLYKDLIYGPKRYEEFKHALNFDKTGYAKKEYWMSMPDMGYLIATYYKVIVIYLSNAQCLTLLPLMLPSELHDLELPEIAIGFVKIGNKGHFVQVNLSSGLVPIPPISSEWHKNNDETAEHLYLRYQAREEKFKQVLPSAHVAGVTKIMDLDDDSA